MDIKALRQKILDLAIRGKLVPQDPNDEPASVLLERIRAEKQQMVKDGKLKPKDIKNNTIIFVGEDNLHYEKFQDGTVKCIEDEIPFEVPEGWEWSRANCISDVRDGTHDTPAYVEKGVPLITSKNLTSAGVDYSNVKYISVEDATQINQRSGVDVGDILFAMIGTIGNPKLVTENTLISIKNVALFKFSYNSDLSHHYILRVLEYLQEQMKENPSGGLQPFVSLNRLRTTLLPIAPITEQNRIVEKLENLLRKVDLINYDCDELDTLIKAVKSKILDLAIRGQLVPQDPNDEPASVLLERIRAEKEELIKAGKIKRDKKESIIFRGEDNSYYRNRKGKLVIIDNELPMRIPNTWTWTMLPEIVFFQEGPGILKKDFREKGIPLIRISGLQTDAVSLEGCNYLDPEMVEKKWSHFKLDKGDVILCTSASIGKASIVGDEAVGSIPYTGQIRFKMSDAMDRDYFLYLAISNVYLNQVNAMKTGNCIQHYGPTHLQEVYVPLPPLTEQKRIVTSIKKYINLLDTIESSLV